MRRSPTSADHVGQAHRGQPHRLPRAERITDPRRVRALYRASATPRRAGLRVYYARSAERSPGRDGAADNALNVAANGARDSGQLSRVVVCPSRGFPTAVARNRQRRLVREAFRLLKHRVAPGYDLRLDVSARRRELSVRAAGSALGELLGGAGLLGRD